MKKITIYGIVILLFSTILNLLLFLKKSESTVEDQSAPFSDQQISFSRLVMQWRQSVYKGNRALYNTQLYRGSDTTDSYFLSELATTPHLVLTFSGNMCTPCIAFAIEKLNEYFPEEIENGNILLICSDIEERLKNNYKGNTIWSPLDNQSLPINSGVPAMFILDQDMTTKLYFTPDDIVPQLTDVYLYAIKERFFANGEIGTQ